MGKSKGFRSSLADFISSDSGQQMFNFAYSFGAAIVILGALFKLLHLPGADIMLGVGMGAEALIFALSAFDKPAKNYKWENVFPQIDEEGKAGAIYPTDASPISRVATPSVGAQANPALTPDMDIASQHYVAQINEMSVQFEQLKTITASLTRASEQLLHSYGSVSTSSEKMQDSTGVYLQQMESLNRNVTGLNNIYEIQMKSVSAQLETLERVNSGLANIRTLYDNSSMDSFKIRQETERMTENLAQLNKVYERMLSAMTANMQQPLR